MHCKIRSCTVADRVRQRELQQRAKLLLRGPYCFQDSSGKPNAGNQEGELREEIAQLIPIALHPSTEFVHGRTLAGAFGIYLFP
jgi:hypothetical protein